MNEQQTEAHTYFVIETARPSVHEAQELLAEWMDGDEWNYLQDSRLHHVLTVLLGHVQDNPYGFSKWQTNYQVLGAAIEAGKAMRSLDEAKVKYVEVSRHTKTKDGAYSIWIGDDGDVAIMGTDEDGMGKVIFSIDLELIITRFPELSIDNIRTGFYPSPAQFSQAVKPFDGHNRDMADKIALDSKWHNRMKKRLLRLVAAILKLN